MHGYGVVTYLATRQDGGLIIPCGLKASVSLCCCWSRWSWKVLAGASRSSGWCSGLTNCLLVVSSKNTFFLWKTVCLVWWSLANIQIIYLQLFAWYGGLWQIYRLYMEYFLFGMVAPSKHTNCLWTIIFVDMVVSSISTNSLCTTVCLIWWSPSNIQIVSGKPLALYCDVVVSSKYTNCLWTTVFLECWSLAKIIIVYWQLFALYDYR